jgi:membrane-associated protein
VNGLRAVVDFVLHLDRHLASITAEYGAWTYAFLSAVIFCETGLVVAPILPGDSLLFAAGTLAALGSLDPWLLFALLATAAVVGDNLNYWVGRRIGVRAFTGAIRFLNPTHLDRTKAFFARHGARTIVLARFLPIIRTFTPFVAGVGAMPYFRFLAFDIGGGVLWVGLFVWAGYFFGNIPTVRHNFSLVILAIIVVSALPMGIEVAKGLRERAARRRGETA